VKRLIVLLIVLAGGLAAATFAVPSNAATVNGAAISQDQVNSDLSAIAHSQDYQCFLNAEELVGTNGQTGLPPVDGVGQPTGTDAHPTASTAFASNYVDTLIGHQLVLQLAAENHLQVTAQDVQTAHAQLESQITAILQDVSGSAYACGTGATALTAADVLATMPSSFIDRTLHYDATVGLFEEHQAGVGPTTADLERYFTAHANAFDTACFTVAEYTSLADAQAAAAKVAAGTPFAQVASQVTGGGPQGCEILYGVASSLPAGSNLQQLPLNTVSSPIAVNGNYLLIEMTKRTPTTFAKAKSEVRTAAVRAGANKARTAIDVAGRRATVTVDPRYGNWAPAKSQVLALPSPPVRDVLNAVANNPASASASGSTASSGQTP
jgi:hypothetical protein